MRHNDNTTIPAVGYLRCSSAAQELSIDQQRAEIEPYAASKGYNIIRWYIDEGMSASKDTDKRVEFLRMIEESGAREFKVIVTYDASRFSRLDGIDGNHFKKRLRDHGIILDTIKEGAFDWTTAEGRWKDQAFCEANKSAALNISKDSLRGRKNVLKLGYWASGSVPYGYDRLYTDGKHEIRVSRTDRSFKKGRNWHLKLVVNEAESAIVREIFDRVVKTGISLRALSIDLTRRGIPSPEAQGGRTQGHWDKDTVKGILGHLAYTGTASLGRGRRTGTAHNRSDVYEQEGACPVIVDRATYAEAQELLATKRNEGRKPQYEKSGTMSGFVVCGHCGYRMKKNVYPKNNRIYYTCESAIKHPGKGCKQWRIYEDVLMPDVIAWLVEEIDAEFLRAIKASSPRKNRESEETLLRAKVKDLQDRVEAATKSALLAPPSVREKAWAMAEKWQTELTEARERLSLAEAVRLDPGLADFATWWGTVRAKMVKIPKDLRDCGIPTTVVEYSSSATDKTHESVFIDRDAIRGFLTKLGFTVKLWWRHEPEARLTNRRAPAWIVDRQEIGIRYRLPESPVEGDNTISPQRTLEFIRSRKATKLVTCQ